MCKCLRNQGFCRQIISYGMSVDDHRVCSLIMKGGVMGEFANKISNHMTLVCVACLFCSSQTFRIDRPHPYSVKAVISSLSSGSQLFQYLLALSHSLIFTLSSTPVRVELSVCLAWACTPGRKRSGRCSQSTGQSSKSRSSTIIRREGLGGLLSSTMKILTTPLM